MKPNSYTFVLFLLFTSRLFSQTPDTTFKTFGIFQIGKSDTAVIAELSKELGKKYNKAPTCDPLDSQPNYFVEFISDSTLMDRQCEGYVVPDVRTFCLETYHIGTLELTSVSLIFYHNVMIELSCKMNPDIQHIMDEKYGSCKTFKKNEDQPCGAKRDSIGSTMQITQWWTKATDKISVYSELYNIPKITDCSIISSNTFYIRDIPACKAIDLIQMRMHTRFIMRSRK